MTRARSCSTSRPSVSTRRAAVASRRCWTACVLPARARHQPAPRPRRAAHALPPAGRLLHRVCPRLRRRRAQRNPRHRRPRRRELPGVRERIGQPALEQLLPRRGQRRIACEVRVECLERGEEARLLVVPRQRFGRVPHALLARQPQHPVEQVADVDEDFDRRPGRLRRAPRCELGRRAAQCLRTARRQRRHHVPQENAIRISPHEHSPGRARRTATNRREATCSDQPRASEAEAWCPRAAVEAMRTRQDRGMCGAVRAHRDASRPPGGVPEPTGNYAPRDDSSKGRSMCDSA